MTTSADIFMDSKTLPLPPVFLILVITAFVGCSNSETATSDSAQAANGETDASASGDQINIAGSWKIDNEETIKANSALMSKPGIDAFSLKQSLRGMILDFELFEDKTFDAFEVAQGIEADYSGVWELKGNKVKLLQKTRGEVEEEDELVGTVDGDRMDMAHSQQGVSLKIVLTR